MSTLVVGDLHLKQRQVLPGVDECLARRSEVSRVVFLGDACDDWGAREPQELGAMEFFADWVERRRAQGLLVDVLLGNHDFCYIRGKHGPGSVMTVYRELRCILEERLRVRMATVIGGYLCSHAGVTGVWAAGAAEAADTALRLADRLNEMLDEPDCWEVLDSCPPSRGGWSRPGPLWADLRDLVDDPIPELCQIVGHTPVLTATRIERGDAAIWACDTLSLTSYGDPIGDGSMLLVDDGGCCEVMPFPGDYHEAVRRYWGVRW